MGTLNKTSLVSIELNMFCELISVIVSFVVVSGSNENCNNNLNRIIFI